jgi:Carboxypeptidase regulatory-like domain
MLARFTSIFLMLALASFTFAQKKNQQPAEKAVRGVVTDAAGTPVPGAVVQLKNMKTLEVRSFIAKEQGDYFFHGLATDVDYELKAQFEGKASAPKVLSSFDSHAEAMMNLQLKP